MRPQESDLIELGDLAFTQKYHFNKLSYQENISNILERLRDYTFISEDWASQKVNAWNDWKITEYIETIDKLRENLGLKPQAENTTIKNALWNVLRKLNRKVERQGKSKGAKW